MKRLLVKVAAILLVVGGAIAVTWPVETWRLYDANWDPLALTQAESFCAGQVLAQNGYNNQKNNPEVDLCVAESSMDNTTPSVGQAVRWACQGVNTIEPAFIVEECVNQINAYDLWFLQHGGITYEWNSGNHRPIVAHSNIRQAPRGERGDDTSRSEGGRFGE